MMDKGKKSTRLTLWSRFLLLLYRINNALFFKTKKIIPAKVEAPEWRRLKLGNNWWSRLLLLLYWMCGLSPLIKGNWIGSAIFLLFFFILWQIVCWIVNGSKPKA